MIVIVNIFERVIAFFILLIIFPILIIISVLIKLDSRGPIIFIQKRIGRYGREFSIYKFRTLSIETKNNLPSSNIEHINITKIGKFLRKSSLDELPQLFNIVKGDMKLIGYRPVIQEEKYLNSLRYKYNITNRVPGITGMAQINGRDNLTIEEKIEYEKYYNYNKNIGLDFKIIFITIYKIFIKDGISQ